MLAHRRYRLHLSLLLVAVVPLGFATKIIETDAVPWINNSLGGLFYVMYWIIFFLIIFPATPVAKLTSIVFSITCLLEFSQLLQTDLLNELRSHYIIRTIIGNSFNKADFIFYIAGALLSYICVLTIKKRLKNKT